MLFYVSLLNNYNIGNFSHPLIILMGNTAGMYTFLVYFAVCYYIIVYTTLTDFLLG